MSIPVGPIYLENYGLFPFDENFPRIPLQSIEQLGQEVERFHENDKSYGISKRRHLGIYYTNALLAKKLAEDCVAQLDDIRVPRVLEPSSGNGIFIYAYLEAMMTRRPKLSPLEFQEIINSCYLVDIDQLAIDTFLNSFSEYFSEFYGMKVSFPPENTLAADALFLNKEGAFRQLHHHFNSENGFDLIITNPPYRMLKANRKDGSKALSDITRLEKILKNTNHFKYLQGVPNLYKLFIEAICFNWLAADGVIGLLVPQSLLKDSQSSLLRMTLFSEFRLSNVYEILENSAHFSGVGQACSMFSARKGKKTTNVQIFDIKEDGSAKILSTLSMDVITRINRNQSLHVIGNKELPLIEHLSSLPTISERHDLVNMRGELDMTLDSHYITDVTTNLELIKGAQLSHYQIVSSGLYVNEDFLERPKGRWSRDFRLACQQISNSNQTTRLKWSLVPPSRVLANSTNFISIINDDLFAKSEIDIFYLLAVLNSRMLNKRFKILSPNNHVSNLEISTFPFVLPSKNIQDGIARMVQTYLKNLDSKLLRSIDEKIESVFGVSNTIMKWET